MRTRAYLVVEFENTTQMGFDETWAQNAGNAVNNLVRQWKQNTGYGAFAVQTSRLDVIAMHQLPDPAPDMPVTVPNVEV